MYVFKDYKLGKKGLLRIVLTVIYGIGYNKSSHVCDLLGYGLSYDICFLTKRQFSLIGIKFKKYYMTGHDLKRFVSGNLNNYYNWGVYKGIRVQYCLPARGQRTKSNYKTVRRLGKFENR